LKRFHFIWLLVFSFRGCLGQPEEGISNINGTQLFIKTIGQGEPIVVVHGGPGLNHTYLEPHFDRLAKNFQVVFYDQRASGRSSIPSPDSVSLDLFAGDIEGIRNYLNRGKIYILAHSWGVIPAMHYAIKYPDRVKGMIFCNAIPLNKQFDQEMRQAQLAKSIGLDSTDRSIIMGSPNFRAGKASAYRKLMLLSFRNSFHKSANYEKLDFTLREDYKTASTALYMGLSKDLSQYDYYENLKSLSFPILIMHADKDVIPMEADRKVLDNSAHATLKIFKKSGHFIFIEENKKFTSVVKKFVK
jgi:proline iminopeptidase